MPSCASFNIYHRKSQPGLCCAVRNDREIPNFIGSQDWVLGGTARNGADHPGFRRRAADTGDQLLGYYLFHAIQA